MRTGGLALRATPRCTSRTMRSGCVWSPGGRRSCRFATLAKVRRIPCIPTLPNALGLLEETFGRTSIRSGAARQSGCPLFRAGTERNSSQVSAQSTARLCPGGLVTINAAFLLSLAVLLGPPGAPADEAARQVEAPPARL